MTGPREATVTSKAFATGLNPTSLLVVPGALRRASAVMGDLLALAGIVFCFPFVILGIGIPIALCVRLLLWIIRVP
jgi:hypothetical protein